MSDDSDLRSYTRRGALGLMGAGGVLAATETFGFTRLTADRGVGVSVAGDDSAAIEILGNDSGGDKALSNFSNVSSGFTVKLSNNSDTTFDTGGSGTTVVVEATSSSISDSESVSIDVAPGDDFDESSSTFSSSSNSNTFSLSSSFSDPAIINLTDNGSDTGNSLTFKLTFNIELADTSLTVVRSGITFDT